jgi:hypothetical protein
MENSRATNVSSYHPTDDTHTAPQTTKHQHFASTTTTKDSHYLRVLLGQTQAAESTDLGSFRMRSTRGTMKGLGKVELADTDSRSEEEYVVTESSEDKETPTPPKIQKVVKEDTPEKAEEVIVEKNTKD